MTVKMTLEQFKVMVEDIDFKNETEITNAYHAYLGLNEEKIKRVVCKEAEDDESLIDTNTTAAYCASTTQFQNNTAKFQAEYNYWRSQGQAHIVAYRKAVDYYRKHLKHEVTVDWQAEVDKTVFDNSAEDTEERLQFNQVVALVANDLTERQFEMLCYIIVQQDLDAFLDEEMLTRVYAVTGENRPKEMKEIAVCMGLKLSKINVCTPLTKLRERIQDVFRQHNFVLGA